MEGGRGRGGGAGLQSKRLLRNHFLRRGGGFVGIARGLIKTAAALACGEALALAVVHLQLRALDAGAVSRPPHSPRGAFQNTIQAEQLQPSRPRNRTRDDLQRRAGCLLPLLLPPLLLPCLDMAASLHERAG